VVELAGRRPRAAGAEKLGSKNMEAEEKKGGQTEAPTLVEVEECLSSALSSLRFHHAGFHHAGMPLPDWTPSE
jgi:hypothetical protein